MLASLPLLQVLCFWKKASMLVLSFEAEAGVTRLALGHGVRWLRSCDLPPCLCFLSVSTEPPPPGQPPAGPPPAAEEVNSDDSDEIVLAVPLPAKRSASRPQASARCPGAAMLRQVRLEDK